MTERPDYIPEDYGRIVVVGSLSEVFNTPYNPANCVLYPRRLSADFNALARTFSKRLKLDSEKKAQHSLAEVWLQENTDDLIGGEEDAAGIILADMREARLHGLMPRLRVVAPAGYNFSIVYDFHEDGNKQTGIGRFMCCYTEPVTEGLRNEDAVYTGEQKYVSKPGARAFHFMPGDVWKQAVAGLDVPPFIHRAGRPKPGEPRLLLVAE